MVVILSIKKNQGLIKYLQKMFCIIFQGPKNLISLIIIITIAGISDIAEIHAQNAGYIKGKTIDLKTTKPLPFVTVTLKKNILGVHSNAEGDFKFMTGPEFMTDSLIFTCIGYKRCAVYYNDLSSTEVNIIKMEPSVYELDEVRIVASRNMLSARRIVARAISNIRWNYPRDPFNYVAYYRDYQKKNNDYLNLNEAIIQVVDGGFRTKSIQNRYKLLDFRINVEFPRINISHYYDTLTSPYYGISDKFIEGAFLPDQGGNELFILMVHDAIRNFNVGSFTFVNTFSRDFLVNHSFTGMTGVFNDNLLLYKISFIANPKLYSDSLTIYGDIYIQPEDYSIHKLDYYGAYIQKGYNKKEMFNIKTEYGYENAVDSKMCLRYISFNNSFNVIDTTDISYFRILRSYFQVNSPILDFSYPTKLFIEFNNKIDPKTANDSSCYEIFIDGNPARISKIDVGETKVMLNLESVAGVGKNDKEGISKSRVVFVKNIRDINGRMLDERKFIEYYQFRELFIQEYNNSFPYSDSCFIVDKPLIENCVEGLPYGKKYWMNSPVNIKNE